MLERDPRQSEAWSNLVKFLANQKRLPDVVSACPAGLRHCGNEPELLLLYGTLHFERNDLAAAEIRLLRLLEIQMSHTAGGMSRQRAAVARYTLVCINRRLERNADAEAHWRSALAEVPEFPAVRGELGRLYEAQGRMREYEAVTARQT